MSSAQIDLDIRQAEEGDIGALYALYEVLGKQDEGFFEACFEKDCIILIASALLSPHSCDSTNPSSCDSTNPSSCDLIAGSIDSSVKQKNDKEARIDIGFGILNFEPKYRLYQKLDIPEIQDLNVIPEARKQGVATALLNAFENLARDQGKQEIGISVGLTADYGPAQRLYIRQGYMPDGYGVTHDRGHVEKDQIHILDDDLALMMIKFLQESLPR